MLRFTVVLLSLSVLALGANLRDLADGTNSSIAVAPAKNVSLDGIPLNATEIEEIVPERPIPCRETNISFFIKTLEYVKTLLEHLQQQVKCICGQKKIVQEVCEVHPGSTKDDEDLPNPAGKINVNTVLSINATTTTSTTRGPIVIGGGLVAEEAIKSNNSALEAVLTSNNTEITTEDSGFGLFGL